ncbi:MAG: DEAD/DEAH box helicase [Ectothiorhodospiraceae bacterium AqS1]|nr:DEAD/DEAH box helicase [Ectothiorhodospiraceae bacterium AqS1]
MAFNLTYSPDFSPKINAFPYQLEAFQSIRDKAYSAVFHEQGLGKTKIAIDLALYWLSKDVVDTIFIVTKKALVKNWCDELKMHTHISYRILSDNKKANGAALNSPILIYVLNYEVCLRDFNIMELFLKTCRVGIILDESQKIKNPEAKLTQAFLSLSDGFVRKVIMTGTPVANRPHDIWSQIKFLDGGNSLGNDFEEFKTRVNLPSGVFTDEYEDNLSQVQSRLRDFSIRETKATAEIELPEKKIISRTVELSREQRIIYEKYRSNLTYQVQTEFGEKRDDVDNILKLMLRLVQCASNPAIFDDTYRDTPSKFTTLEIILNEEIPNGEKAIIWTSFIKNTEWLDKNLKYFYPAKIHGDMKIDDRNTEIDRFKYHDSCRILIATPGAAKEGLTLTVANHAIFYDRSFSLDDYLQAQDRIHRISQNKECHVYNLIGKETIDEWVNQLLYAKFRAAQLVQGDLAVGQATEGFAVDLSEMLEAVLRPQHIG